MGEIEDALRRARQEQPSDAPRAPRPVRKQKPADDVYATSADLHRQEQPEPEEPPARELREELPREPSPPAPPPTADASSPRPSVEPTAPHSRNRPDTAEADSVALTQDGVDAQAPQGMLVDDGGAVTDACLQLALRVRKAMADREARTLVVVSAFRNEGKTTVSCNLALALASLGQFGRIALVDLDLRRPSLETVLELSTPTVGIADVLTGLAPLPAARVPVNPPRLDVYPCLRGQPKAHELLLGPHFERVISELRESYDLVIFDSPPSLLVPDATIIMQHVECFAPVARAGITRARPFKKMLDMLPRKRMLGGILDGGAMATRKGYYHHYGPDAESEPEPVAGATHGG